MRDWRFEADLRVGLNLTYLVEDSGGSARYARELIPALMDVESGIRMTAWVGATAPDDLMDEPWAGDVDWVRLPVPGVGSPWHLWHELVAIGFAAQRRRLDVIHGLAYLAPIVHPGVASVATILDVIWMHHPDTADRRFRAAMRTLTPVLARTSNRVVAISQAAREDIAATLHLNEAKIDVTPLGIAPSVDSDAMAPQAEAVRERLGIAAGPLVLCVAAKRRHKNLHTLVQALALLDSPRPQLVLPGSSTEYERELRSLAHQLGVSDSVCFLGWISDADLEGLYRQAACFVLPSLLEGFGLPVLEAMSRGVPVVCSDIPVLREVGGQAALLCDPQDAASFAGAIARVVSDASLASEMARRGRERCEVFTWRRTAEATLESYRRALHSMPKS